jgi:hypothetical protein
MVFAIRRLLSRRKNRTQNLSNAAPTANQETTPSEQVYYRHQAKTPPASMDAINDLIPLRLRADDRDHEECLICSEIYEIGCVVTRLPCGHMYHSDCIIGWLHRNCTCPICRYELPTDDPNFEQGRTERMEQRQIETDDMMDDEMLARKREKAAVRNLDVIMHMALGQKYNFGCLDDLGCPVSDHSKSSSEVSLDDYIEDPHQS